MRISLQLRVLLLVAAINVAVFGAGLAFLTARLSAERRELADEFSALLVHALVPTIGADQEIKVAQLLRWPSWKHFEDAIILGRPWDVSADGEIAPRGAFLNPVGRAHRRATFEEQSVLADIAQAVEAGRTVPSGQGVSFPIVDAEGRVWGGCWFALVGPEEVPVLVERLLPWFLSSTLLLTLGTFSVLRRFVLEPVHALALGAQRVSRGDFSARLAVPRRRDELADLIRGFNAMTSTVGEYNERLAREVLAATDRVRRAEAAAMTERRLAATGELAAGVAHEINNPLGGLLNAVEVLESRDLPPEKRAQYFGLLRSGLERIRETVGRLLRFTPRGARAGPVELAGPVRDAIALVRHRAAGQGVAIELSVNGEPAGPGGRGAPIPPVAGEASEIGQAVLNLLVNSLDALEGRPSGRIDVSIEHRPGGEEVRLEVRDDGPGVGPEELARVADLFYTTKGVGKGSGLGLAIVHRVVASHKGRVHMSSEPGQGFAVEIFLPVWRGTV